MNKLNKLRFILSSLVLLVLLSSSLAFADLYINILAVNGTDKQKEETIKEFLPPELSGQDVVDTAGLDLDYDVEKKSYFLSGKISLGPKETKTYKVLIRDLWKISQDEVDGIKAQIEASYSRLEGTEYFQGADEKKKKLLGRLDYIYSQQERFADDIQKRIDRFRAYKDELASIRNNAVSVKYWRTDSQSAQDVGVIAYVIEVENTEDVTKEIEHTHYLPAEVKPEHIVDLLGFDIRYDAEKSSSYLSKTDELAPKEKKSYRIEIRDIWNVAQNKIEGLKTRTRDTYALLENTEYAESAKFLVKNIKENLDAVEASQAQEKSIKQHISDFRGNEEKYNKALKDVEALEELLEAVREDLERSRLRNVLQKIKSLKSIADISQAIFGTKPTNKSAWKIITGIVIFVGFFTFLHFAIWGKRSRDKKLVDAKLANEEEEVKDELGD